MEDEGRTQVCYKYVARTEDPVRETDEAHLLSSAWEDPRVYWPGAATLGLNGFAGAVYTDWSGFAPRFSRGYTVYRPEHWTFAGTDLYTGGAAGVFGYDVDGVKYTIRDGLPYATGEDGGSAENLEILAMGLAHLREENHRYKGSYFNVGDADATYIAETLYGDASPENLERVSRGAGMMAVFQKGADTVFNAGTCEWVSGLNQGNFFTDRIARNVPERFTA